MTGSLSISEYILSLAVLGALSGAVMVFAPDNGVKKYLRYLVSLIIALTLLMPLKNVIFALPQYLESISGSYKSNDSTGIELPDSTELLVNYTARELRSELEYSVKSEFGIDSDILPVFDASDPQEIRLEYITASLNTADSGLVSAVKLYLESQTGCAVTVNAGGDEIP